MSTYEEQAERWYEEATADTPPPPDDGTAQVLRKQVEQEAALRDAIARADLAMAMVDDLQRDIQRGHTRTAIKSEIAERKVTHKKAARSVKAVFYGNFILLGLIYYYGAGVNFTTVGSALMNVARLAGLTGGYLLLVQLLLVGRLPVLDRIYGMDKLTQWHARNGRMSFSLIVLHAVAAVVGRAFVANTTITQMMGQVIMYKWMIPAVIGLALMTFAIFSSIRKVRRTMDFNWWQMVHMWTYLGVAMSFGHQLFGPDFKGVMWAQSYIWATYGLTFIALLYSRILTPMRNTFRYQLQVDRVIVEGPGVTSIYIKGFGLERMKALPGQFAYWRFFDGKRMLESHPFSFSSAPGSQYLRITVKSLGDFTSRIHEIPVGTWVSFEGPFGRFTHEKRTSVKSVLLAGGVGITPIRSLLEGMPSAHGDIAVVYRADRIEDAVLLQELEELAASREAELHVVLGDRATYPTDRQPLSAPHLRSLIPDIDDRDIFICASPGMTAGVRGTLKAMGLSKTQVHHETFA